MNCLQIGLATSSPARLKANRGINRLKSGHDAHASQFLRKKPARRNRNPSLNAKNRKVSKREKAAGIGSRRTGQARTQNVKSDLRVRDSPVRIRHNSSHAAHFSQTG